MPKFAVDIKEVWTHTIEVKLPDGATKEEIVEAANQKLAEGEEGTTEYSHTLDPDTWGVRNEAGNYH